MSKTSVSYITSFYKVDDSKPAKYVCKRNDFEGYLLKEPVPESAGYRKRFQWLLYENTKPTPTPLKYFLSVKVAREMLDRHRVLDLKGHFPMEMWRDLEIRIEDQIRLLAQAMAENRDVSFTTLFLRACTVLRELYLYKEKACQALFEKPRIIADVYSYIYEVSVQTCRAGELLYPHPLAAEWSNLSRCVFDICQLCEGALDPKHAFA